MKLKIEYYPPTYLNFSIVLMIVLYFLYPIAIVFPGYWRCAAIMPLSFGIILNLAADKNFKKNDTTVKPFEEFSILITSDVFRSTRNPIYLGMVLVLLGIAGLLGSLSPFIIIPIFILFVNKVFVDNEEKILEKKFGEIWHEYYVETRKWI